MPHNPAKLLQDVLDAAIVWQVIQDDLPHLLRAAQYLLKEIDPGQPLT